MGEDDQHHGHLAHGRGRPAPRSPRPWARTTITKVTSPMNEDDQHHGHLAHGRGRPSPRSPRPWARTTSTTVTSPMADSPTLETVVVPIEAPTAEVTRTIPSSE
ncbi:hypothetical protein Bca101_075554 [Brassica carinata]